MSENIYNQEYYEGNQPRGILSLSNKALISLILRCCSNRYSLLEIGCAKGAFLAALEPFFDELIGIDISDYAIQKSRKISGKAKTYQCDIQDEAHLSDIVKNKTFDVIVSLHTFEHLDNPIIVLRRCRELLKNEGVFFLVVPNPNLWLGNLYNILGKKDSCAVFADDTHASLFTRQKWESLLLEAGFKWEFRGRPFFAIKSKLLDWIYPNYYYNFMAETGYELLFICRKTDSSNHEHTC